MLTVVDYLGLAHELKRALATHTESGGEGQTALDKEQAVRVMLEKYEVCCGLFHGFDRTAWTTGSPADRLNLLPAALEHVLAQEDGKARCLKAVRELSQAFALAVPHPQTVRIRDDVPPFQHVRAALSERTGPSPKSNEELDQAVRQIVSRAVASNGVVDISAAAGLKKPDVSVLSEDFLREVQQLLQQLDREVPPAHAAHASRRARSESGSGTRSGGASGSPRTPTPRSSNEVAGSLRHVRADRTVAPRLRGSADRGRVAAGACQPVARRGALRRPSANGQRPTRWTRGCWRRWEKRWTCGSPRRRRRRDAPLRNCRWRATRRSKTAPPH